MPKRNFTTLEEFKANLHREGATLVEFSGKKIPCLLIGAREHDQLLQKVYGKAILAEPVLDIFYDGRDVFVDVQIKFAKTDFDKNYLLYANGMLEFFEALAETGLLGIAPDTHVYSNSQNMFTIQLARTEPAKNAFEIIKANSKRGPDKNQ